MSSWERVDEVPVEPRTAVVYEHGWQSWSPSGVQRVGATSPRPARARWQTMAFRPGMPAPARGFQGEGLLALQADEDGPVRVWSAPDPHRAVPSIRGRLDRRRLVVEADGPVDVADLPGPLDAALRAHADGVAARVGVRGFRSVGTGWCSWYGYLDRVTQADVEANLAAADAHDLRIDTIQIDDGYQSGIGDWLSRRVDAFPAPLTDLAARIADTGRQAGIWTAPFCVGLDSELARAHPDWLVGGAEASDHHWGQRVGILDVTHPAAAEHLVEVFATLTEWGFAYHKVDFLYAGAMDGRRYGDASGLEAYAEGLALIRRGIGDAAVLLGCGAPLLASIGRFDAMRVSPDIDPQWEPPAGDLSQPSQLGALAAGRARAWQHGRWWVNDPDCIVVRPGVERRDVWAGYLSAGPGLAVSGDPLDGLDAQGLEWTRRLLVDPPADGPRWLPDPDDPEGGRLAGEEA